MALSSSNQSDGEAGDEKAGLGGRRLSSSSAHSAHVLSYRQNVANVQKCKTQQAPVPKLLPGLYDKTKRKSRRVSSSASSPHSSDSNASPASPTKMKLSSSMNPDSPRLRSSTSSPSAGKAQASSRDWMPECSRRMVPTQVGRRVQETLPSSPGKLPLTSPRQPSGLAPTPPSAGQRVTRRDSLLDFEDDSDPCLEHQPGADESGRNEILTRERETNTLDSISLRRELEQASNEPDKAAAPADASALRTKQARVNRTKKQLQKLEPELRRQLDTLKAALAETNLPEDDRTRQEAEGAFRGIDTLLQEMQQLVAADTPVEGQLNGVKKKAQDLKDMPPIADRVRERDQVIKAEQERKRREEEGRRRREEEERRQREAEERRQREEEERRRQEEEERRQREAEQESRQRQAEEEKQRKEREANAAAAAAAQQASQPDSPATAVSAASATVPTSATSQAAGGGAADANSPEGQYIKYKKFLDEVIVPLEKAVATHHKDADSAIRRAFRSITNKLGSTRQRIRIAVQSYVALFDIAATLNSTPQPLPDAIGGRPTPRPLHGARDALIHLKQQNAEQTAAASGQKKPASLLDLCFYICIVALTTQASRSGVSAEGNDPAFRVALCTAQCLDESSRRQGWKRFKSCLLAVLYRDCPLTVPHVPSSLLTQCHEKIMAMVRAKQSGDEAAQSTANTEHKHFLGALEGRVRFFAALTMTDPQALGPNMGWRLLAALTNDIASHGGLYPLAISSLIRVASSALLAVYKQQFVKLVGLIEHPDTQRLLTQRVVESDDDITGKDNVFVRNMFKDIAFMRGNRFPPPEGANIPETDA